MVSGSKLDKAAAALNGAAAAAAATNRLAGEMAELHRRARNASGRREQAPAGGSSSAGALPVREGYQIGVSQFSITGRSNTSMRLKGQTVLGAGRIAPANASSCLAFVAALNPASFSDRLGTQARLYDKYVYHSLKLQYIPSVGTSTNGSVAMYLDRDYMDPAESPDNLQAIMSAESASMGPAYSKVVTQLARDSHEKRTYFTNGATGSNDFHETEQFKAVAYFVNADTINTARTLGTFILTYDLELISPVFAPSEFYNFNNFAYNTANAASYNALSSFTSTVPFGFTNAHQFSIVEICIADLAGNTQNTGFTWGSSASNPTAVVGAGSSLFLRRIFPATEGVSGGSTAFNYRLYDNLADAQMLGEKYLLNTNAVVTSLFNGAVGFW